MRKVSLLVLFLLVSSAFWQVLEQLNGRSCADPISSILGF